MVVVGGRGSEGHHIHIEKAEEEVATVPSTILDGPRAEPPTKLTTTTEPA